MTETPEERKQRLLAMITDGPSWRHPIHRLRWLRRKRKHKIVRLGAPKIGPIELRVRQNDGTTKRVTWEQEPPPRLARCSANFCTLVTKCRETTIGYDCLLRK